MTAITVRTRKFMTDRLLSRKQMIVDISTPTRPLPKSPRSGNHWQRTTRSPLTKSLPLASRPNSAAARLLVSPSSTTQFRLPKKVEPRYRLIRHGLADKIEKKSRKQRKELRNRQKKVRGTKKATIGAGKKK